MEYKLHDMTDPIPALAKLEEFSELRPGWHFGEGMPSKPRLTKTAKILIECAVMNSLSVDVFPGVDGEIMVCIYHGSDYLEITFESDESITYIHERNDSEVEYSEGISLEDVLIKLKTFQEGTCQNTSEQSTENTTMRQEENLRALHSNNRLMVGFLASTSIAFTIPVIISVDTSEDFTDQQMTGITNTRSSGSSQWTSYLQAA